MSRYDNDTLVCPPEPKPPESPFDEYRRKFEADELKREAEEAARKQAYEMRTRDFKISESAVLGGDPYEGEE